MNDRESGERGSGISVLAARHDDDDIATGSTSGNNNNNNNLLHKMSYLDTNFMNCKKESTA